MKIYFKNCLMHKKLLQDIFCTALSLTGNDAPGLQVGVCITDKNKIAQLNKTYRGIDKATDVLSFPFTQIDYKTSRLKDFDAEREPDGRLYIGDIYICKQVAKAQARQFGHSYKRELCFLALHGFLHLLGYDHVKKEDEKVMMAMADKVLQKFNVTRGGKNV